jgi:hypothetical protein
MVNSKKALESLWQGTCDVIIRQESTNPINKRIEFTEVSVYSNQPCKLSFKTITSTAENSNAALVTQAAKLFIAPEVNIPAGSKIIVTQNGKETTYEKSGEPAIYSNHQEVSLELFKGWA